MTAEAVVPFDHRRRLRFEQPLQLFVCELGLVVVVARVPFRAASCRRPSWSAWRPRPPCRSSVSDEDVEQLVVGLDRLQPFGHGLRSRRPRKPPDRLATGLHCPGLWHAVTLTTPGTCARRHSCRSISSCNARADNPAPGQQHLRRVDVVAVLRRAGAFGRRIDLSWLVAESVVVARSGQVYSVAIAASFHDVEHRRNDVGIGAATAQVAVEPRANLGLGRLRVLVRNALTATTKPGVQKPHCEAS